MKQNSSVASLRSPAAISETDSRNATKSLAELCEMSRLRKQILKLKLEMGNLEQKLAELNFQIKPDPLSTVEITKRRVARLESELNKLKVGLRGIVSTQLNWDIFPSNQDIAMTLKSHFGESISKRGGSIDFDRLYRIIECFKPVRCFIGKNEFDGYLVFLLQQTNKVICDNPMIGNAIYILDGDWEKLSQQSKSELLGSHKNIIRRIIHKGNWIDRLRCAVLG